MELPFSVSGSVALATPRIALRNEAGPAAGDDTKKLTVETVGNHIYFYSEVNSDRGLALVKEIQSLDGQLRNERTSRGLEDILPPTPMWLHVYSGGGSLHSGLALSEQIARIKSPIYSIVEGYSASAATLISMSATRRYILPNSFMLIHELSTGFWGKYTELGDEKRIADMAMEALINFYVRHSKMKPKEIKELLTHDSWFNAQECVERGLADEILT